MTSSLLSRKKTDNFTPTAEFSVVSPAGPNLCHHTGGIISDNLYIHGGIDKPGNTTPLNAFHKYSFQTGIWTDLTDTDSPPLSYHASVVLENRYFVLIGGWNGKVRTSDLHVYDCARNAWLPSNTRDFPVGSGLSSHTTNLLSNGKILVIGREGFLKTQRRFSSMFIVSGCPVKGEFRYRPLQTTVGSRSGHTCDVMQDRLYIIGGRHDTLLETHPFSGSGASTYNSSVDFRAASRTAHRGEEVRVSARKYHVTAVCNHGNGIFVHGGWTFDGRKKDPVSDCYLLTCTGASKNLRWISLGDSNVKLAGHVSCVMGDKIYIQGGEGEKGAVKGTLYEVGAKMIEGRNEDDEVPFYDFEW